MNTEKTTNRIQSLTAFPPPGLYDAPHMITLMCETPGADIHYTLDGSTPTQDSQVFDIVSEILGHPIDRSDASRYIQYYIETSKIIKIQEGHYRILTSYDEKISTLEE